MLTRWLLPCTYNVATAPDGGQQGLYGKAKQIWFGNRVVAF